MSDRDLPPPPRGFDERNAALFPEDVAALERLGFLCDSARVTSSSDATFREAVAAFQRSRRGVIVDGLIGPQTRRELASALPKDEHGIGYLASTTAASSGAIGPLTRHITTRFLRDVAAMAKRWQASGARVTGKDILSVLLSESGIRNIQNLQGYPAYGLNQLFAPEKNGRWPVFEAVGFRGTPQEYLALSLEEQLPFVERYFLSVTGGSMARMRDGASLYLLNFMPAYASHADDPSFVLARRNPDGPAVDAPESEWKAWREAHRGDTYAANRGFDRQRKGTIVVGDLQTALDAAKRSAGPYWTEVAARYDAEAGDSGASSGALVVGLLVAGVAAAVAAAMVARG